MHTTFLAVMKELNNQFLHSTACGASDVFAAVIMLIDMPQSPLPETIGSHDVQDMHIECGNA